MRDSFNADSGFLSQFQTQGFFLDDLVLYSINQIKRKDRNERFQAKMAEIIPKLPGSAHTGRRSNKSDGVSARLEVLADYRITKANDSDRRHCRGARVSASARDLF